MTDAAEQEQPSGGDTGGEGSGEREPIPAPEGGEQSPGEAGDGGDAGETGDQGDQSDNSDNGDAGEQASNDDFQLPDEYKEKGWAKNLKSMDDVYKALDNAQTLVGKKSAVPDFENSTEEQIQAYYQEVRPESPEDYNFGEGTPDASKEMFGQMLHEEGIPKYQGDKLIEKYQKAEAAKKAEMYSQDGFDEIMKNDFGDNEKQKRAEIKNIISENTNEADRKALNESFTNEQLGLVYRMMDNIIQEYGVNESGTPGENGAGSVGKADMEGRRKELRKQIKEISSKPHSSKDLADLKRQLADSYKNDQRLRR